MSESQDLKGSCRRRLLAAETSSSGSEEELHRQRKLLKTPEIKLQRAVFPSDVQQLSVSEEELPPEQQERRSSLDQEDSESIHIKEEQEELEADTTKFPFTIIQVKSEDEEEEPQSSQLHQRQSEQMEIGTDGEDCGGPKPARCSDPQRHLQLESEVETEDSRQTDRKPQSLFECGKTCKTKCEPTTHMRSHTGEKPFSCSDCGQRFKHTCRLKLHITHHREQKPSSCSVSDQRVCRYNQFNTQRWVRGQEYEFHLNHNQETREAGTGADGEDCGGPEPERLLHSETDIKSEDSDEDWRETRGLQSGLNSLKNEEVSAAFDSESEESFYNKSPLEIQAEERRFSGFGNRFTEREVLSEHIMVNRGVKQEDSLLKDEQEEVRISQPDAINSPYTPVPVKSEEEEETHQFSQLHPRRTEQMKTGAEGEDCGGPETEDSSEPETDDSDDWRETRDHHSGLTSDKTSCGCPDCGETSQTTSEMTTHMRVHTKERTFSCSVCRKTFNHKGNLSSHMLIHTGDKPFSCSVCGKRFSQKGHLTTHMLLHTGDKPFSCSVCNKRFYQKGHLSSHILVHTEERPFSCSDCGQRFKRRFNLKLHMAQHREQASELSQSQTEADREAELGLDGEDSGGSDPAVFEQKQDPSIHSRKKLLSCSVCGKRFKQKGHLITHMFIHTGEKPFSCSVCGKGFRQKGHLTTHMVLHSGEKPFNCSFCSKRFNTEGSLKRHMMGHTGEKPLSCSTCGEGFSWSYQLKKHQCVGAQARQLIQNRTENMREAGSEADEEDCRGPELAKNSDPE